MERPQAGTPEAGQAVLSLAGRDAGRVMVVVSADAGEGFVLAADGRRRKLSNPKRKRAKHLRPLGMALKPEEYSTDRQLRRTLSRLQEPEADNSRRV